MCCANLLFVLRVLIFWAMTDHNENLKSEIKWNGKQYMNYYYCVSNFFWPLTFVQHSNQCTNVCMKGKKNRTINSNVYKNPYHSKIYCTISLFENVSFVLQFPFFSAVWTLAFFLIRCWSGKKRKTRYEPAHAHIK